MTLARINALEYYTIETERYLENLRENNAAGFVPDEFMSSLAALGDELADARLKQEEIDGFVKKAQDAFEDSDPENAEQVMSACIDALHNLGAKDQARNVEIDLDWLHDEEADQALYGSYDDNVRAQYNTGRL